ADYTGTLSGVAAGDSITASYDSPTGDPATATVSGSTDAIVATLHDPGTRMGNHPVTNTPGALSVDAALLTVTATSRHKPYGTTLDRKSVAEGMSGEAAGGSITAS